MKHFHKFSILLLLPLTTLQISNSKAPNYTAAVAEYKPITKPENNKQPSDLNAENYLKFIAKAAEFKADILVFPESSLTTWGNLEERIKSASYMPEPRLQEIVCGNKFYAQSLRTISCGAKKHRIYVVINHHEKVNCSSSRFSDCPSNNLLIYNTNVVFDREGRLIARYRKYNLFGEPDTNRTPTPELSIFETDFGVMFGQFICFDLLFPEPALALVRRLFIDDIIFSSHWFSELPFLYGVQAQAGWAYANNVNLIASGYNNPDTASGGSGIYIGQSGYTHIVSSNKATNILLVSEVPKVIKGQRSPLSPKPVEIYEFNSSEISTSEDQGQEGVYLHLIDDLKVYSSQIIETKSGMINEKLCDRGFCCEFKIDLDFDSSYLNSSNQYYRYRMVAFNGTRTFSGVATGGITSCGIIACINETQTSCGELLLSKTQNNSPWKFKNIEITTESIYYFDGIFMPVSFTSQMLPLNATDYKYQDIFEPSDGGYRYGLNLTGVKSDLLTFAIYGRNFANDGKPVTNSAAALVHLVFDCKRVLLILVGCIYLSYLT